MWNEAKRRRLLVALATVGWVLMATPCLADTLRGTLRSIDPAQRRIVVTDKDGDDNRFVIARTAAVTLNGKRAGLDDLRAGDRVVVTFTEDPGGTAVATAVEATRKPS